MILKTAWSFVNTSLMDTAAVLLCCCLKARLQAEAPLRICSSAIGGSPLAQRLDHVLCVCAICWLHHGRIARRSDVLSCFSRESKQDKIYRCRLLSIIRWVTSVSRNRLLKNVLGKPVLNGGIWLERQRPEPEKKTSRETPLAETPKACECSCGFDQPFHKHDTFSKRPLMWKLCAI